MYGAFSDRRVQQYDAAANHLVPPIFLFNFGERNAICAI
jgi:hypothetical protein